MPGIGIPLIFFGAFLIIIALVMSQGRSRASATTTSISGPVGLIVLVIGVVVYRSWMEDMQHGKERGLVQVVDRIVEKQGGPGIDCRGLQICVGVLSGRAKKV